MRCLVLLITLVWGAERAAAWSESGHHLIALYAFDQMELHECDLLLELLESHPRYQEDFQAPQNVENAPRWIVGYANWWPDVARRQPRYNRPKWHYEPGSTLVIGNGCRGHETPGPLPPTASLVTRELHIAQAVELCRRVMSDPKQLPANRALAACWIGHLVADAHQPCHAGSLYCEGVFPDGDRGANSIKTKQSWNLHSLWDGLLGRRFNEGDVSRRLQLISELELPEGTDTTNLTPHVWLEESRETARAAVYTEVVMGSIRAVREGKLDELPTIDLSEEYLKHAGAASRIRAVQAGHRLAAIWSECLAE